MTLKMPRSLVAVLLAGLLALPAYADTRQVTVLPMASVTWRVSA